MALRLQGIVRFVQLFDRTTRQDSRIEFNLPESRERDWLFVGNGLFRCMERILVLQQRQNLELCDDHRSHDHRSVWKLCLHQTHYESQEKSHRTETTGGDIEIT